MGARPQHDLVYRKLCRLLRQWRTDAGLTQRDLAAILKKPHTYVHKTETGERRIDPVELIRWCRAVGIEPTDAIKNVEAR